MIHAPNPLIAMGVVASTAATDAVYVLFTAAVAARRTASGEICRLLRPFSVGNGASVTGSLVVLLPGGKVFPAGCGLITS